MFIMAARAKTKTTLFIYNVKQSFTQRVCERASMCVSEKGREVGRLQQRAKANQVCSVGEGLS